MDQARYWTCHICNGREPVAISSELGHAANFLYMLKGASASVNAAELMDTDRVLHAEHGSNASSFFVISQVPGWTTQVLERLLAYTEDLKQEII